MPRKNSASSFCQRASISSSPGTFQTSLIGGSATEDIPAMNIAPPSVWTPTVAPFEPCTQTFPKSAGFCELLTRMLPRAPPLKRRTAIDVSSTSIVGWLRFAQAP